MTEEFINYLKYIGLIDENNIENFISIYNSTSEQENDNLKRESKNKKNIINTMIKYIKSLTDEQISAIMTKIYERYKENKIKIESKKLLNLIKIYKNKEIKFYFVYWERLSKYLKHKEIQEFQTYQQQLLTIKNDNKNINNNSNFISGNYLESMTVSNNKNNKNNFIPNNISMIKARNSDIYTNNYYINNKPKISMNNFIERQEKYLQLKKKNLMKNIDSNEEEFQLLYTFKPCLAESTKSYFSGYNNLASFRDSKKNRKKNLYSNKIREVKMKNLRQTVDNERGLTFKPRINSNKSVTNMYKKNNIDF